MKPRLLDLFCGAGGAAVGYNRAGFEVIGVDIKPQPHYPFEFHQADALTYPFEGFDAYHASPPCQGYSIMNNLPWLKGNEYPLLILSTLKLLESQSKPYVLENVMGAKYGSVGLQKRGLELHGLQAGWLCGGMFGLPFYRHRLFATNWFWLAPGHPTHRGVIKAGSLFGSNGGRLTTLVTRQYTRKSGRYAGKVETTPATETSSPRLSAFHEEGAGIGHTKGWRLAAKAMGIDWMNRQELSQAIPPAYTEYIGGFLLRVVLAERLKNG